MDKFGKQFGMLAILFMTLVRQYIIMLQVTMMQQKETGLTQEQMWLRLYCHLYQQVPQNF